MPTLKAVMTEGDIEERLRKLKQLYERGVLTDDEYSGTGTRSFAGCN